MAGIAMVTIAISSCDENTTTLGDTLTSRVDQFTIAPDTFNVKTSSIRSDSVVSQGSFTYLGRIKDPETGTYVTSDYTTRFNILENETSTLFPPKANIVHLDAASQPIADSCFVNVMVYAYQGDSLEAMKLQLHELAEPLREDTTYYTNFNPEATGKLRTADKGGIVQNKVYSISDLTLSDSLRSVYRGSSYYEFVKIPLNKPYTDKNNQTYNNYGTYLLRTYYEHPEYFRNANSFARNVCPGFYLKTTDGLSLMMEVAFTQLQVYYQFLSEGKEYTGTKTFNSTEEVLQTTHVTNDKNSIKNLVESESNYTFLKTPAGIYTEVELPIDDIKMTRKKIKNPETGVEEETVINHLNDTIVSAKIVFSRMNSRSDLSDIVLEEPTTLLLIERDSLYSFFEHRNIPNNITSYLASYNSKQKTYSFNNISGLVNRMWLNREKSPNWNKAILIPVQLATSSGGTTSTSGIANEMNLNSVRLVRGTKAGYDNAAPSPIRMSVIYNQNK